MNSFLALAPLLTIVLAALVVLILEAFIQKENKNYLGYISLMFLIVCAVFCVLSWNANYSYFDGVLHLDQLALLLTFLFLIATAFVMLTGMKYISLQNANFGEFYALLLLALSGMMIMVSTVNFLVIFLGLEVLSVSSYALAGLKRKDEKSSEAAIKYFLMGSFASAFLVFGLALLFGASHEIAIPEIVAYFASGSEGQVIALIGLGLVIIGFAFKIALVPFHMWTPDVYEGAPTPVTAFFSVGPKSVGFAVLLRLFASYWNGGFRSDMIHGLLWAIAVLTMLLGNLIALRQKNVKRMLAYSSIAHAGYILVALLARDSAGLVFYLASYLFMNIGAFSALMALSKKDREYLELDDFSGIGFQYPWIGATFAVFLFSLAGFPPTAGFLAKFYVFSAAVRQGLVPLVIIGVLASLISVFYYLRIIVYMYMKQPEREIDIVMENPALFLVLFLCLYGVLQLGIFPGNILVVIRQAVSALF
jgi:NADH-quinone oxidoreductase subunit N